MHNCQSTHDFILAVQRQCKNVHGIIAEADERAFAMTLRHGLGHFRRRRGCMTCPNSEVMATTLPLPVVDSDAHQMFAVAEALYQPLQSPLRTLLPRFFHIARDTFAKHFGAPFQIAAQRALFPTTS